VTGTTGAAGVKTLTREAGPAYPAFKHRVGDREQERDAERAEPPRRVSGWPSMAGETGDDDSGVSVRARVAARAGHAAMWGQ